MVLQTSISHITLDEVEFTYLFCTSASTAREYLASAALAMPGRSPGFRECGGLSARCEALVLWETGD